jgi:threonine/homoserine/homoserine lactone efflux protein|tara:strand:- start:9864 stop:10454 length:591 start_codon:yes stop_codon:yes gene_type:complete
MAVFIAMCAYSLSMSISPGPVNLVALTSGLNKGFRRAIPFVSGAAIGFALLLLTVGLGVGMVTTSLPLFLAILSYSGSAFIFYMGLNIATADPVIKQTNGTSSSFIHGFVLQWLNPKAWIASISGIGAFEIEATHHLFEFVAIYFLICYASIACWALVGHKMNLILSEPKALKIFNLVMGGLLMMVAVYLLLMQLM